MEIKADKIRCLMWEKLMTQKKLCEVSGLSRMTIQHALSRGSCSIATAEKLVKCLGVEAKEIIDYERMGL